MARHVAVLTEDDPTDLPERRDRFGEESLELQQALGQTRAEAHALVDYVHSRPVGDPAAEMGGVMYTAAALAREAGLDMAACAESELSRLSTPEMTRKIRAKRATRHGRGPLPGFDCRGKARPMSMLDVFAEGALARAAGSTLGSCPHPPGSHEGDAWLRGWSACDAES